MGSILNQSNTPPRPHILREAWGVVDKRFYDRDKLRSWKRIGHRYMKKALAARNHGEVIDVIQAMLGELGVSHLRLIEPDVFERDIVAEISDIKFPSFGMTLKKEGNAVVVSDVVDGGSAYEHQIIRGDKVTGIDGAPPLLSPLLRPSGSGAGSHIAAVSSPTIEILRGNKRIAIRITPKNWNYIDATQASINTEMYDGLVIGYIHLWHMSNAKILQILKRALFETFKDAQGLILDLRGFGGNIQYPKRVKEMIREWRRPVVAIIDSQTRSSKEILAYLLRKHKLAVLVGERTKGAVLGGDFVKLSDGSQVIVPVLSCEHLTDGISLEKNGIKPDVHVKDKLGARDPILEAAAKVLRGMIK